MIPNRNQRTVKEPSSETLLRLAELVLTLNCFSFAGNYYKQINGVAMGTKMGPSYANLFVGYVEHQFFIQYDGPKPDLYGRYIDDCISAISSSREELNHGLSLHQGTTDSRKNLEQRFIFQIGTLNPHGINERFSFNVFLVSLTIHNISSFTKAVRLIFWSIAQLPPKIWLTNI